MSKKRNKKQLVKESRTPLAETSAQTPDEPRLTVELQGFWPSAVLRQLTGNATQPKAAENRATANGKYLNIEPQPDYSEVITFVNDDGLAIERTIRNGRIVSERLLPAV